MADEHNDALMNNNLIDKMNEGLVAAFDSKDEAKLSECVEQVKAMVNVLGLTFAYQEPLSSEEFSRQVEALIQKRQEAKLAKDFAQADAIRVELEELGVTLKDMKDITMWSFNG
jgi:cysteinyl-tRNA synthetase